MKRPVTAKPPENPFAAIWKGMADLAKRHVALEQRTPTMIRVGPAYVVEPGETAYAREIQLGDQTFRVLVVDDDPGAGTGKRKAKR